MKESELKTDRHNRPEQKSELKTKKQDQSMKDSELKKDRHNRPIQKSKLDTDRLYRPRQSEDRIGIGRSLNRTFRPPMGLYGVILEFACYHLGPLVYVWVDREVPEFTSSRIYRSTFGCENDRFRETSPKRSF